jgi:outer membrane protein TolC
VLTAFEQVEDELATLRILEQQFDIQHKTVQSANLSLQLTLNQYRAGTVAYTSVVTAQTIALGDAEQLLTIRQNRLTASVALIQALGGGWSAEALGSRGGNPSTAAAPAAAASVAPPTP